MIFNRFSRVATAVVGSTRKMTGGNAVASVIPELCYDCKFQSNEIIACDKRFRAKKLLIVIIINGSFSKFKLRQLKI